MEMIKYRKMKYIYFCPNILMQQCTLSQKAMRSKFVAFIILDFILLTFLCSLRRSIRCAINPFLTFKGLLCLEHLQVHVLNYFNLC